LSSAIRVMLWEKFVGVCGTHALAALMRLPVSALFADPEASALVRGLMEEAEQVGRASGLTLPEGTAGQAFESYRKRATADPSACPSIYYDLAAGRRLEVEHTNGAVVRFGRRDGVATPLNFAVYPALRPWADGRPPGAAALA
jgi:2-dehydropantoate 2-reductase